MAFFVGILGFDVPLLTVKLCLGGIRLAPLQIGIVPARAYVKAGKIVGSGRVFFRAGLLIVLPAFAGCAGEQSKPPTDQGSVDPGSAASFNGDRISLLGSPIFIGAPLPSVPLVDAMTMKEVNLSQERGKVLFLSLVPSPDTPVCEVQTDYLGEEGDRVPGSVKRITISRDTPLPRNPLLKGQSLPIASTCPTKVSRILTRSGGGL